MTGFLLAAGVMVACLLFYGFRRHKPDISNALRDLLLARADGSVTAEEFEARQSALHAALLMPQTTKFSLRSVILPVFIVLAASGIYAFLGNPQAIDATRNTPETIAPSAGDGQATAHADADMRAMVQRLANKLAKDPANGEGWALLAHSYVELHMDAEATDAFAKAAAILPANAGLLADWADAYVMSHDRKWDQQSRDLVKRALRADSRNLKALALAGSEAFDRADYKGAITYWTRLKAASAADSMDAKLAEINIQEANALMTGKRLSTNTADGSSTSSDSTFISGTVALSAKLKGSVAPSDTVFVIAKTADGSGPPLAVKRYRVSDLPITFRLDETSAVVPGRNLSVVTEALLLARVSKSGNAIPQPDDIQTAPILVKIATRNAKLELR